MATLIDTDTLASITAGGDSYIRTKDGVVKGLAIRRDLNPEAPEIILVGNGPRIVANARLFAKTNSAVPTFVKRATNAWEFIGNYKAVKYSDEPEVIAKYANQRPADNLAGVLFLEQADTPKIAVTGGGFPDSKTRIEIEKAAISFVTDELKRRKYVVEDRQPENQGYDLLASQGSDVLLVEVKGTDATYPHFFLTRNEWKVGGSEARWRLFVVCQARTAPKLHEYTFGEINEKFTLEALAWEGNPRA
jgi:hypothetical protein